METESAKKIIVEVDVVTGEQIEREATADEMANWPPPFAANPPLKEIPTE